MTRIAVYAALLLFVGSLLVLVPAARAAPAFTSISPTTGTVQGGDAFTIFGTGFVTTGTTTVTFGGVAATGVVVASSTALEGYTPAIPSAGPVSITITNPDATTVTVASAYTYQAAVTISNVAPKYPVVGVPTTFTVTGTGFSSTQGAWYAITDYSDGGGVQVTPSSQTAKQVVISYTFDATATKPTCYYYFQWRASIPTNSGSQEINAKSPAMCPVRGPPTLTSLTPAIGFDQGGTKVLVMGRNLTSLTTVSWNGGTPVAAGLPANCGASFGLGSCLQYTVPAGTAGTTVSVTVTDQLGRTSTLTGAYSYIAAPVQSVASPAAPGAWQTEYLSPGPTASIQDASIDHDGEAIGIAFWTLAQKVGFAYRASAGSWVVNQDVSGAGTSYTQFGKLVNAGPGTWLIQAYDASGMRILRSADNGVTWAIKLTDSDYGATQGDMQHDPINPARVLVGGLTARYSSDGGNTWGSRQCTADDDTNPATAACHSSSGCPSPPNTVQRSGIFYATNQQAIFSADGASGCMASFIVATTIDQTFWSDTYTSGPVSWCSISTTCNAGNLPIGVTGFTAANGKMTDLVVAYTAKTSTKAMGVYNAPSGADATHSAEGCIKSGSTCTNFPYAAGTFQEIGTCPSGQVAETDSNSHVALTVSPSHTYLIAFRCMNEAFMRIWTKLGTGGSWSENANTQSAGPATGFPLGAAITQNYAYIAYKNVGTGVTGGRLELYVAPLQSAVARLPTATASVTNLVGMDVDPWDKNIIARTNGGTTVATYDPVNGLAGLATQSLDAGCAGKTDGVGTFYNGAHVYTTYFNCASDGTTNRLAVRGPLLGTPDQGASICNGDNFCDIDLITGTGCVLPDDATCTYSDCSEAVTNVISHLPTGIRHIGLLHAAIWDWQTGTNPDDHTLTGTVGKPKHATIGFTYSDTTSGNLGAFAITQNNNNMDCTDTKELLFSAAHTITSFCSVLNFNDGKSVVAGIDPSGPTQPYEVGLTIKPVHDTIDVPANAGEKGYYPVLDFTSQRGAGPTLQKMNRISCAPARWGADRSTTPGQHDYWINYDGVIALLGSAATHQVYRTHVISDNKAHVGWSTAYPEFGPLTCAGNCNVALSLDGHWGAYLSTDVVGTGTGAFTIINATSGVSVGTVTIPNGAGPCCMYAFMDDTAQRLYAASGGATSVVMTWDIHDLTTVYDVAPGGTPVYGFGNGKPTYMLCTNVIGGAAKDCSGYVNSDTLNNPNGNVPTGGGGNGLPTDNRPGGGTFETDPEPTGTSSGAGATTTFTSDVNSVCTDFTGYTISGCQLVNGLVVMFLAVVAGAIVAWRRGGGAALMAAFVGAAYIIDWKAFDWPWYPIPAGIVVAMLIAYWRNR